MSEQESINVFIGRHSTKYKYYAILLNKYFEIDGPAKYLNKQGDFTGYSYDTIKDALLLFDTYEELIDILSEKYDITIVDTPDNLKMYEGDTIVKQN